MSYTIALPKGRLGEDTEQAMIKAGLIRNPLPKDSRKLIFQVNNDLRFILVRAWDVPAYVEMGTADIGVCGKDDLIEHNADVLEMMDLGFGFCRMTVSALREIAFEDLLSRSYVKVATKYPNITGRFFRSLSVQAEIIKLYGSVELAAVTGMSDCIVDIVSTGGTLKENGLHVLENIFESTARLIINRASYYQNMDYMNGFIEKLKTAIEVKIRESK